MKTQHNENQLAEPVEFVPTFVQQKYSKNHFEKSKGVFEKLLLYNKI